MLLATVGWAVLCCGSAAGVDARSPGKWLVDLGRDYPLTPQAGLSSVDAEIALLFMQAAARVEPDLAEAWRWQVDLLNVLHREGEVQSVLEAYCRLVPDDVPARLAWTRTRIDALQTADARAAFCRKQLAEANPPPVVASELRYRLADFHWNRGEREEARRQAEAALKDDPYNLAARRFLADIAPPEQRWIHRVSLLVAQLEVNPGDLDTAMNLGDELRLHGLAAEAEAWYSHAQKLSQMLNPGSTPTGLLLARAAALMELNRLNEAQELARQAVEAEPMTVDTLIVRAQVALLKGDAQSAESHFRLASKLCKSTVDNAQATQSPLDSNLLADLAWFFAHYDPKPDYAAMLSQTVLAADPDNVVARRVAAALMLRNNQLADAERLLLPVAEKDLWAAILLAEVYKKAGREEQVASKLRELTTRPANFEQRYLIQSKCRDWKVEPLATQPAVSAARKLAASIAPERRDYPFHPDKYLTAALSVSETNVLPGEPWWCTLRLTNKADFPITIGNGCMLEPAVLAVVEMRGDRRRSSDGAMQMLVDGRLRLMPRETLEVRQALDLGTIRAGMIGTPQVTQEVQLAGIINPRMVTDRENQRSWQPGIGGFKLAPVTFRRSPLSVDDGLIGRLAAQTRSGPVESRGLAMEQLAMLLGEHQHLAAGRVRYPARPIDVQAVRAAVLGMAGDSDWYVRARLAECMRWFMLDETTMPTAMKLLNDSHWLVRSLARRLLADQHGGKFSKVLETSAQTDPDPWAGKFARAILERQRMVAAGASEPQPERAGGL